MSKVAPVDSAARTSPFFDKCYRFDDAHRIQRAGLYTFFRVVDSAQDPEVVIGGRRMIMKSRGMEYVVVNGRVIFAGNCYTGETPGRVLRS